MKEKIMDIMIEDWYDNQYELGIADDRNDYLFDLDENDLESIKVIEQEIKKDRRKKQKSSGNDVEKL